MKLTTYIAGISLAVSSFVIAERAEACGPFPYEPYSYNPFCVIEPIRTVDRKGNVKAAEETLDFWKGYTKGEVSEKDIQLYFDNASFRDPRPSEGSAFISWLERKHDDNAINYLLDCLEFSALCDDFHNSGWEYHEKDPAVLRNFSKKIAYRTGGEIFAPRYDLLRMRAAGSLHDDATVMEIWEKRGKGMKPSLLRDRMGGFVGGVLYRQGKYPEALDYFYKSGDNNSIAWCVSKIAGPDNLRSLYEHDPNSTATLYALTDYMNYLISHSDAGRLSAPRDEWENPKRVEAALKQRKDFISLCDRVLADKRCENPMAWAVAKGAIELTMGDYSGGLSTLDKAYVLKGDSRQTKTALDNFRLWGLLLNSGKGDTAIDARFASELEKVYANAVAEAAKRDTDGIGTWDSEEETAANPNDTYLFLTTFFAQEAKTHFMGLHQAARALAIMGMMEDLPVAPQNGSGMFQTDMRELIFRTLDDNEALAFISLAEHPSDNPLDRYLGRCAAKYLNLANEAYATRLLCRNDFEGSLGYLKKVDTKWLPTMAVYPYLRRYTTPYYYNFRRNSTGQGEWSPYYPTNYKALFCAQMIEDMKRYEKLKGDEKAEAAFRLAANYHQASPQGDAWAISDYAWTVATPVNSFNDESLKWLRKALEAATDTNLKCEIYYAILSSPDTSCEGDPKFAFGRTGGYDAPVKYFWDNRSDLNRRAMDFLMENYSIVRESYLLSQCDVLSDYAASRFVDKPEYY
ncbi:MAG: hypothetical protein K2H76_07955 [Muribaculaceae bacterium]|nr:hypothetical protein [Muribaculaceae bacterium]MDE6027197.1 hypothetical protein [Muribaculaceae bacterium]